MALDSDHDDLFDDEPEISEGRSFRGGGLLSRQTILVGLVVAILVCLVIYLIYGVLTDTGDEVAGETPTPLTPTEEGATVIVTVDADQPTATATRVLTETEAEATAELTAEATTEGGPEPTATQPVPTSPTPTEAPTTEGTDLEVSVGVAPGKTTDLIENSSFEEGFDEEGVGLSWDSFTTEAATISFSKEITGPYVRSGSSAQRISIAQVTQSDQYGGLAQQVEVVPNRPYTLTLHGMIRTGFGDVNQSSYGYRMQYALSPTAENWREVPADAWVELPWDEQLLGSSNVEFLEYTTQITPTAKELTLFVRAWNKWAEPGLVEYTLDDIKLVGAASRPAPIAQADGTDEELIDQPLPTTGAGDTLSLVQDARFWGAMLVLLMLGAGAIYRSRWGY
jgi:hypothetical protein